MTKQVKEIYTDLSGKTTVEYSDDSIRIIDIAKTPQIRYAEDGVTAIGLDMGDGQSDPIAQINERALMLTSSGLQIGGAAPNEQQRAAVRGDLKAREAVLTTKLKQFYSALYAGATVTSLPPVITRPKTNLVRVLTTGDSVGESKVAFIHTRLVQALGDGGRFFASTYYTGGAETISDGAYWVNGIYSSCPAGGTVEYLHVGGRPTCDTLKIYYVREPGAGTFKVQVNSGAGYVDEVAHIDVSASSTVVEAGIITIAKPLGNYSVKIVGLTGTVKFLSAAYINATDGGCAVFQLTHGGLSLSTMNETPDSIKAAIFEDLNVDLAFMEFKDGLEFPAELETFMTSFEAATTKRADWVFVGTSPQAASDAEAKSNNLAMAELADERGYAYFDGYGVYDSYASLVDYGWQGDGTHLPVVARAFAANALWETLGFGSLLEVPTAGSVSIKDGHELLVSGITAKARFTHPYNHTYRDISISYNYELIFQGARSISFRDAAGTPSVNIGTGSNSGALQAKYLALVPVPSTTPVTTGPALRPTGSSATDGFYSSNVTPGNGSALTPFGASEFRIGGYNTAVPSFSSGAGSPEGVKTAAVGSIYSRTDGGAGTTMYVKESGTGNTGWVAK